MFEWTSLIFQIQFCIIFHHNFQVLFRECSYPKTLNFLLATQAAYFLYLFGVFYYKQYVKSSKVIKSIETKEENSKNIGNNKNEFLLNGKIPTGTANQKVLNGSARKQKWNWDSVNIGIREKCTLKLLIIIIYIKNIGKELNLFIQVCNLNLKWIDDIFFISFLKWSVSNKIESTSKVFLNLNIQ